MLPELLPPLSMQGRPLIGEKFLKFSLIQNLAVKN
jgi:hypothetical protein